MAEHTFGTTACSERAAMYLKAQLIKGRKEASGEDRKGYREKFAEKIGVDSRTLSRYCIAIHDVDTIAMIASALGVSLGDMLSFEGEDVPFCLQKKGQNLPSIIDLFKRMIALQIRNNGRKSIEEKNEKRTESAIDYEFFQAYDGFVIEKSASIVNRDKENYYEYRIYHGNKS